jgi:dTDP-4-amino-4,6-dideoxygalactose transaminase
MRNGGANPSGQASSLGTGASFRTRSLRDETQASAVPTSRAWRTDRHNRRIPVARPRLPGTDALLPYLRRIDEARWYSNGGALVRGFEARLAERTNASSDGVALIANATLGLALALAALEMKPNALCMLPAWTFAASAQAVMMAGLVPWLVDVDAATWALTPALAREYLANAPGPVGAIMPVLPFGAPIGVEVWEELRASEGVAVVIDAAAGFDVARASSIPAIVSLHATKALAVGEGAFAVCRDSELVLAIRQRANFGLLGDREAKVAATNAKLSEYAAAVGLAGLDEWEQTRSDFQRVAGEYVRVLAGVNGVALQPGFGSGWVSATVNVAVPANRLDALEDALDAEGFGSRRWWGDGLVAHRAFRDCPRTETPVTARLGATVLGLPCYRDLPSDEIERIGAIVARVCS